MSNFGTDDGDIEFPFNSEIPPRVPNGEYEVSFLRVKRKPMFGNERVFLWFKILTPGEWYGRELYMTCKVPPNGRWGTSSKFLLSWVLAAGKNPTRRDRMNTSVFRNKVFRAKIRVVTETWKQAKRTREQEYSVIDELLEVVAGGGCQRCA
jgi:hypothetical protein